MDYIKGSEHYIKEFATWEATEQIIDDNKAFWMLRKPGSQCQKVCLYRDGCNMFIYGDYGQFTFDSMTWTGSVYNLEYNNIGYQMEKLSHESRESLGIFDKNKCEEDIFDWLKEQLESYYSLDEDELEKVSEFFNSKTWDSVDEVDIEEFCDKNDLSEIEDIIGFTKECCRNIDEYEWIQFLRSNYNRLYDFGDEPCESWLWNAGKCIHQRYFICMYALQVCGEKIKAEKGGRIISTFNDLFLTIETKLKVEDELKEIKNKIKKQANELELSTLADCTYETGKELYKQIQYCIDDNELLNKLSEIIEAKKIEKYPELLKPTYYPEIDSLDIPESEKLRLDKAARWNIKRYLDKNSIKELLYPLSIDDLELLKSIGVVEKKYNFRCRECRCSCKIISGNDLEKYKRFWELFELEKQKVITDKQRDELDQLDQDGFYEIYLYCDNDRECDEIEITNEKELNEYMNNVEVVYSVAKSPDLRYEKL